MRSGITTYKVVGGTWESVLNKIVRSAKVHADRVVRFDAVSLDDPRPIPERRTFAARVETIHLNAVPITVDFLDDYGNWFQMKLDPRADDIIFEVLS